MTLSRKLNPHSGIYHLTNPSQNYHLLSRVVSFWSIFSKAVSADHFQEVLNCVILVLGFSRLVRES